MPIGPGKYDDLCTLVRERTEAKGVLLIVVGGNNGLGFSCQADLVTTLSLPQLLRTVADMLDADTVQMKS